MVLEDKCSPRPAAQLGRKCRGRDADRNLSDSCHEHQRILKTSHFGFQHFVRHLVSSSTSFISLGNKFSSRTPGLHVKKHHKRHQIFTTRTGVSTFHRKPRSVGRKQSWASNLGLQQKSCHVRLGKVLFIWIVLWIFEWFILNISSK